MRTEKINLRDNPTEYSFMPTLEAYLIDKTETKRPFVLVIPGGGYTAVCSDREGERIALSYNAAGFSAGVLDYCVEPHLFPEPLYDAAAAIKAVRIHADEWGIDKDRIAVCGFSAGGNLAGLISTLWNNPSVFGNDDIESEICKPNAMISIYGVLTGDLPGCELFLRHFVGGDDEAKRNDDSVYALTCCDKQVNRQTPPAFLFNTAEDSLVSADNAMFYAHALKKLDIPFELHIFPKGAHGLSLVSDETYWAKPRFSREYPWMSLSIQWLMELYGII